MNWTCLAEMKIHGDALHSFYTSLISYPKSDVNSISRFRDLGYGYPSKLIYIEAVNLIENQLFILPVS
jgi:hypothetical protein